jgi:hypothetical protein
MGTPQLSGDSEKALPIWARTKIRLTYGGIGNRYGSGHGALLSHRLQVPGRARQRLLRCALSWGNGF